MNPTADLPGKSALSSEFVQLGTISGTDPGEPQANSREALAGFSSGNHQLDRLTSGLQRGDLIVLAVPPSVDASKIAMDIGRYVALHENKSVGFFSGGASESDLATRLLCLEAAVDSKKMADGLGEKEDFERLVAAQRTIERARFFIDDSAPITIAAIQENCQALQGKQGLDLLIVRGLDAELEELGVLGRDLGIPVVAIWNSASASKDEDDITVYRERRQE